MVFRKISLIFIFSVGLITALIVFSSSALALPTAGKPGAYFWGDLNGTGIIDGPDLTEMINALFGNPYLIEDVIPTSGKTQDLSGTGAWPEGTDLTYLIEYMRGIWGPKPGHPETILLESSTFLVEPGDSVEISAYAQDSATDSDTKNDTRAGWGMVFRVNTAPAPGRCIDVMIQGRDALPQGVQPDSDTTWFPHVSLGDTAEAFAYTLDADTPDYGLATVKLLPGASCQNGDSIEVSVFIPGDDEAHILQTRQPTRIEAEETIRGIYGPIHCTIPEECPSGFCEDGYCCDTDCIGECVACNVPGLEGTCSPIPYGDDPDLECMPGYLICAGFCDGMGACTYEGSNDIFCDYTCFMCVYERYECMEGFCEFFYFEDCGPFACGMGGCYVFGECYSDDVCCMEMGYFCIDLGCKQF